MVEGSMMNEQDEEERMENEKPRTLLHLECQASSQTCTA